MVAAFLKAFGQLLTDPRLWKYAALSALLSVAAFAGMWIGLAKLLAELAKRTPWAEKLLEWGTWPAALAAALFLFPSLFGIFLGLFQEQIADAVEARHYHQMPPADGASLMSGVITGVRFFILMAALNVVALPIYLIMLLVGGSGVVVYALVNGVLFGREYFESVAVRRLPRYEMDAMRRRHRGLLFRTGMIVALLSLVPVINLFAPVWGVAAMVHVFHSLPEASKR